MLASSIRLEPASPPALLVSTLPDGVIDLKQEDPGLTLAPIVVFTASTAA
jgi:hypothetical protein